MISNTRSPPTFALNMCSAGDNYAHAQTVDTRLSLSAHQEPGYEASTIMYCQKHLGYAAYTVVY